MSRARFSFSCEQTIPGELEQVFEFFSDPQNLETITPPWLRFRVLSSSTPRIEDGTLIDYKLRIRGIPVRWRSRIRRWNPPHEFIDEQLLGPYRTWVHHHTFEPVEGGVLCGDHVDYDVVGGPLVERLFVRKDLDRIFDYRQRRLAERFRAHEHANRRSGQRVEA